MGIRSSLQLLPFELKRKRENEGMKGLQPAVEGILLQYYTVNYSLERSSKWEGRIAYVKHLQIKQFYEYVWAAIWIKKQ